MYTKKLLLLGVPMALATGCGTMSTHMNKMLGWGVPVPGATTVAITVDQGPPVKCTITAPVKDSSITVPAGSYDLTWNLQGPQGWRFDQHIGITFPQSGSSNFFTTKSVSDTQFVVTDNNTTAAARANPWPYHIHVENTAGSVKCKLDPAVINDESGPSS
jgi:hypothetical protein